jgi:hypothetical protein
MKKLIRFLVFIIFFNINVSIKAEAILVEEPKSCWDTSGDCAIKALNRRHTISFSEFVLEMSANSYFLKTKDGIHLIEGQFFLRANNNSFVKAKYVDIYFEKNQIAFLDIGSSSVKIDCLKGVLRFNDLKNQIYQLPQAYSVTVGGVDDLGNVAHTFPMALNIKKLLKDISRVTNLNKDSLAAELNDLKKSWNEAIQETQDRSLASVEESYANHKKELEQLAEGRRVRALENKKMRDFFYQKTFLE